MATQYPSNRYSRAGGDYARSASSPQPGISRSASRAGGTRGSYGGSRPASGRSAGYNGRPAGQRSASGQRGYSQRGSTGQGGGRRPAPNGSRRPSNGRPPQRRKPKGRFFAFIAVALALAVALIIIISSLGGSGKDRAGNGGATGAATSVPDTQSPGIGFDDAEIESEPEQQTQYGTIAEMLADADAQIDGLSADQMVQVDGLSINQSLPEEWMNVLLLGTDERTLSDSARTDAVMICSINRTTGAVKLTSIMRDLDVEYKDIGKYSGHNRINAANYFGGPKLAMKTVNELFDMNIQNYVMVNFFGFGKIAQRLGGIEVNISQQEMEIINKDIHTQFIMAGKAGIMDFDPEQVELTTYGENTHLNGNQTLAYARIRHLDGGDYMRTTRQQTVLSKLMEKVKKMNALEITTLGAEMIGQVKTNMELNDIIDIALKVASNGIPNLESFRLPVQGTYKEEVRNDDSRLWDCDFATNAIKLYDFIYE